MDNLTHTMIGALAGEALARHLPADPRGLPVETRRNLFVTLAAICSNLPDSDLLYSYVGSQVNYLLHHRGHTHTLLGALALSALAWALTRLWLRRQQLRPSRQDGAWLAVIVFGAPLLHMGLDFTNNYGVHPFWPLDNAWYYGDSVFIIEPLLWAACTPLAFSLRTRWGRGIVMLMLAAGVWLSFTSDYVPLPIALFYTAVVGSLVLICWRLPVRQAVLIGIATWLGTTTVFAVAGQVIGRQVAGLSTHFPGATLLDHVRVPMPANALCWDVMLIQEEDAMLVHRWGRLSLAPALISAAACRPGWTPQTTAPLAPIVNSASTSMHWYGQVATPLSELQAVAEQHCEAAAALRFMRAPYLTRTDEGVILGDLRYDREPEPGFAEILLPEQPRRCPVVIPPWVAPRQAILNGSAAR